MTDSDESDDENMKMMLESVDTGFLNNNLFEKSPINHEKETTIVPIPKSQRYVDTGEDDTHSTDLHVPEAMQKFIAKKLSEIIERNYEFVDPIETPPGSFKRKKKSKRYVKLLKEFDIPVHVDANFNSGPEVPQKRPEIHRRIIEADGIDDAEKLKLASVDFQYIACGEELKHWTDKECKDKVFEYKRGKDGTLHFIEKKNEFYAMRKKNCWSEKYICEKLKKNGKIKK